tara:strand:- start:10 stop:435 length:426 start_codon:yes stop_codon:yes gene_type:complete
MKSAGAFALGRIAYSDGALKTNTKAMHPYIEPLEALLRGGKGQHKDHALFALHVLAIEHGNKMLSCVEPFEAMLCDGADHIKEQATLGLERIAQANVKNDKWMKGCINPLADLVRNGLEGQRQWAADALVKVAANNEPNII